MVTFIIAFNARPSTHIAPAYHRQCRDVDAQEARARSSVARVRRELSSVRLCDVRLRVLGKQPQQLGACIAGAADDSDFDHGRIRTGGF